MANTDINVTMKLTDQASAGIAKAQKSIDEFEKSFTRLGREMQRVGRNMAFVGGAMITPFVASMAQARNVSLAVANTTQITSIQFERFNTILAKSAIPAVDQFNAMLSKAVDAFEDLDPKLRESVTGFVLTSGAILASSAAVTMYLSHLSNFTGALLRMAPILATIGTLMLAIHDTGKAYQDIFKFGPLGLGKIIGEGKAPEAAKQALADLRNALDKMKETMAAFKSGEIWENFDKWLKYAEKLLSGDLPKAVAKAETAFQSLEKAGMEMSSNIARAMRTNLGDTLFNALTGRLNSFGEAFRSFGDDVLRIFSQAAARFALAQTLGRAMPGMLQFFHEGGVIRPIKAHSGLAPDEVPIIAQTGEGVLSRKGMSALGGSDNLRRLNRGQGPSGGTVVFQPVLVIQAWDSRDVYRNRKVLSEAIGEEIKNNGKIRDTIKKYR